MNPTLNKDSLYTLIYDSALLNIPPCQELESYRTADEKSKDTIGNYWRGVEMETLRNDLNKATATIYLKDAAISIANDKEAESNGLMSKWKLRCIATWILLSLSGLGYGYFKLRKSFSPIKL